MHSTGPKGNIGHPNSADEVEYFKTMLQKAQKHLTDADIDALITSLKAFNKAVDKRSWQFSTNMVPYKGAAKDS